MAKEQYIIDLDKPKEEILEKVTSIFKETESEVHKKGQIALNFLFKKKGEKDKAFVYNLTRENFANAEKEYLFPLVAEEVLKREFDPKLAKNEKLVTHVVNELKKDPYWNNRVVDLIKTLKEDQK